MDAFARTAGLVAAMTHPIPDIALDDRLGIVGTTAYKRSSRDAYIQRLKTRQLVTTNQDGIRASDELFQ